MASCTLVKRMRPKVVLGELTKRKSALSRLFFALLIRHSLIRNEEKPQAVRRQRWGVSYQEYKSGVDPEAGPLSACGLVSISAFLNPPFFSRALGSIS